MKKLLIMMFLAVALVGCGGSDTSQAESAGQTAAELLQAFTDAGLPIIDAVEYTAETDPNGLLGRPGEYIEKINFNDSRYFEAGESPDLTVEVFTRRADMESRRDYIQTIVENLNMLEFKQYFYYSDTMLLRIPYRLTPESASEYEAVFNAFINGELNQ